MRANNGTKNVCASAPCTRMHSNGPQADPHGERARIVAKRRGEGDDEKTAEGYQSASAMAAAAAAASCFFLTRSRRWRFASSFLRLAASARFRSREVE